MQIHVVQKESVSLVEYFEYTHLAKSRLCDMSDRLRPPQGSAQLVHLFPPYTSTVESKPIYGQHLKAGLNKQYEDRIKFLSKCCPTKNNRMLFK